MVQSDASSGATTVAVTSGKDGVGKTSLTTNLAIALQRRGNRTCLLDADMGLANVNVLLGIEPRYGLDDLITGNARLEDLIIQGPEGLHILPAAAGLERLAARQPEAHAVLTRALTDLESRYDYLLVDSPAGIGESTRTFVHPCELATLVITPEPTSLTDAFSLLRALFRDGFEGRVSVVVNMLPPRQDDHRLFERFRTAAEKYLEIPLDYLGAIPMDGSVTQAVVSQHPLLLSAPDSPASIALEALAGRLESSFPPAVGTRRFAQGWQRASDPGTAEPEPAEAPNPLAGTPQEPSRTGTDGLPVAMAAESTDMGEAAHESLEDLANFAESLLASTSVNERDARQFFGRVERSFTARYRRRASDVKTLLYESLLHDHLREEQLREIRDILVETYARRFGADDPRTHAPPDPGEGEPAEGARDTRYTDPKSLAHTAGDWLGEVYRASEWDEAHSRDLLALLSDLHASRFGTSPNPETIRTSAELDTLRERFESTQHELQARLTEACLLIEEHARMLTGDRRAADPPDGEPDD